MDLVFFLAHPDDARQVASIDDLPGDVAAEPIPVEGPAALAELASMVGSSAGPATRQLRDATCRSYPVWVVADACREALAALDDERIDAVAESWKGCGDADLHERASCLGELREALRDRREGEELFVLFEERIWS